MYGSCIVVVMIPHQGENYHKILERPTARLTTAEIEKIQGTKHNPARALIAKRAAQEFKVSFLLLLSRTLWCWLL